MAKVQDDLILAALAEVGAVRAGQTAATEDVAAVTPRIGPVLADLAARRISSAINVTAIPDALFPDLVRILAEHIAPMFRRATNADFLKASEGRLRELSRLDRTASPLVLAVLEQLEIYQAGQNTLDATAVGARVPTILAELSARDVVYVSDAANVPDAAMPDLSRYIAASLATPPAYPVMDAAEVRLKRLNPEPDYYPPLRASYW